MVEKCIPGCLEGWMKGRVDAQCFLFFLFFKSLNEYFKSINASLHTLLHMILKPVKNLKSSWTQIFSTNFMKWNIFLLTHILLIHPNIDNQLNIEIIIFWEFKMSCWSSLPWRINLKSFFVRITIGDNYSIGK